MKFHPFIIACICLTGCAHYRAQPVSPDQTAAQLEGRRLDDAGLQRFIEKSTGRAPAAWPPERWDLGALTLAAFYFHPDLAVARAQWRVATAGEETAAARPNPSVSVSPSYDSQIPGNYSPWLVPVTFDIPIETAGKRAKRIAEAQDTARSAYWSLITAAWQIRSGVRAALLEYEAAGARAELLRKQFDARAQVVKLTRQRVEAGELSRVELTPAQIALNKTELDLSDAQSQAAIARSHLAQALGLGSAALTGVRFDFDFAAAAPAELTSAAARRLALRGRSDILGALADYAAAEDDLRLQVAGQYPDLHLGPGYAWNNGNAGDSQWILGATLELPILDQNQGPIAAARARRELAAAQFIALQARVIGGIEQALADYQAADNQLKTGGVLLAAEERQWQSVQQQARAGEADALDVANAELEWETARLAQLDARIKFQAALGALEDSLQRPAKDMAAAIKGAIKSGALADPDAGSRPVSERKESTP